MTYLKYWSVICILLSTTGCNLWRGGFWGGALGPNVESAWTGTVVPITVYDDTDDKPYEAAGLLINSGPLLTDRYPYTKKYPGSETPAITEVAGGTGRLMKPSQLPMGKRVYIRGLWTASGVDIYDNPIRGRYVYFQKTPGRWYTTQLHNVMVNGSVRVIGPARTK